MIAGQVNSIRVGIADGVVSEYASNVLIAADSLNITRVAMQDSATLYKDGSAWIDALANHLNETGGARTITQIDGTDVVAGDTVTLNSGQGSR